MNQPLIAAVFYNIVRKLREVLRVLILCPFCFCRPLQIHSPAPLTQLETTHKIHLSLFIPPTGFTCTILKTFFPLPQCLCSFPCNQFVRRTKWVHVVKQILLVFHCRLVTRCRLLHNSPNPFPSLFLSLSLPESYISFPALSCIGYCTVPPSLWITSAGLPTYRSVVSLALFLATDE